MPETTNRYFPVLCFALYSPLFSSQYISYSGLSLSLSLCSFCGSRELKEMWIFHQQSVKRIHMWLWNCAYQLTAKHKAWCMHHQLEDNFLLCRARCFFCRALVEMAAASSHPLHSEQQDSTHSDKIQFLNAARVCLIQFSALSFFVELSENRGFSFTNLHDIYIFWIAAH